jgi:hypothetical protein
MMPDPPLPYGIPDLDPVVYLDGGPPPRVRCYVRGCGEMLRPARDLCPVHGIRCHHSSFGNTFSYDDERRNVIAAADLLAAGVVGHPFKYDSDRFGLENAEDTLTWNVFRSLQDAGCLREVVRLITGHDIVEEPRLYLWGLCLAGDPLEPWDLLVNARKRFESGLPVERPRTEPDIALHLPGHSLILVEAKFTSPNLAYEGGPRKDAASLTKDKLLDVYQDGSLQILDVERARQADRVYYQLWRNMVFAEWMALADGHGTQAYHANLTRAGREEESCAEFRRLLRPGFEDRFGHFSWEDLYGLTAMSPGLSRLRRYYPGMKDAR